MHQQKNPYKFTPLFYSLAQAFYWGSMAIINGYTAVYLTSKGVSNTVIGTVVSLSTIIAIAIQLSLSSVLDKRPKTLSKVPVVILTSLSTLSIALMLIFPENATTILAFYTIALTLDKSSNSMLSTVSVKSDIHVAFGIPRMLGSGAYAVTSLCIGRLVDSLGASYLMYIYIPICACTALSMIFMREDHIETPPPKKDSSSASYFSILKENKILRIFLVAVVLIGIGQSSCITFLIRIIEDCGGGTTQLGNAMFIQSFSEVPMLMLMATVFKDSRKDKLLIVSFLAYSVRIITLSFATVLPVVYLAASLNSVSVGIFSAASISFANIISKEEEKARCQALTVLAGSGGLGSVIGGMLSGVLLDTFGTRQTFFIGGSLCFVAFLIMIYISRLYGKTLKDSNTTAAV